VVGTHAARWADSRKVRLAPWWPLASGILAGDVAGDSVVVQVHQRGVGLSSGVVTELRYFQVWTFRGDSIIRIESIGEREQALEAVGLRE
jgi:ketosteroid isomerase-like protein